MSKIRIKDIVPYIVIVLIVAAILFFIKPIIVNGSSMIPTLHNKDYILLSRQAYNLSEPKHGQIVVFPVADGELYIKRVIGLPGEVVEIRDGNVYVDGKVTDQSFTEDNATNGDMKVKVPQGQLFVMGDNRFNSEDSRYIGTIRIDDVKGVVLLRVWPFNQKHTGFTEKDLLE
ncbi:MAG: signal peptidase I [Anaerovoracaceae bacterium]|jgi:signal peptidase I